MGRKKLTLLKNNEKKKRTIIKQEWFAEISDLFPFLSLKIQKASFYNLELLNLEIFTISIKGILATDVSCSFSFDLIYESTAVHSVYILKNLLFF